MAAPIFRDDSTPADRRALAARRLMAMCPPMFRPVAEPLVEHAVSQASDADISALLIDVGRIQTMAETGDVGGIADIARRYGATDDQIATYLPTASI